MTEISVKKAFVANRELQKDPLFRDSGSFISVIDRLSGTAVFPSADLEIREEAFLTVPADLGDPVPEKGPAPKYTDAMVAVYAKYPQIKSIAYTRTPAVTGISGTGKDLPVLNREHAELFRTPVPCVRRSGDGPVSGSGRELAADAILSALDRQDVSAQGALLLSGDGALVWAETPLKALEACVGLESVCANALSALSGSGEYPAPLSFEEISALNAEAEKARAAALEPGPLGSGVTSEQMRNINLALLSYFDRVCRENGIKYSITGGTLIGAIRHGGMIPWDDDIDVFLTRPEYEKLNRVFPENGRYQYYTLQRDPNFNYVYGRLVDTWTLIEYSERTASAGKGLFLDVCVVDGLPKNAFLRYLHTSHMRILVLCRRAMIRKPEMIQKGFPYVLAARILQRFSTMRFWNKRMSKVMRLYPYDCSGYVGNFTSQYGRRELLHSSVFDEYFDIEFENLTCMACRGYEEYLKNIYGDYLSFPPEDQREPVHDSHAVWVGPEQVEKQQ